MRLPQFTTYQFIKTAEKLGKVLSFIRQGLIQPLSYFFG